MMPAGVQARGAGDVRRPDCRRSTGGSRRRLYPATTARRTRWASTCGGQGHLDEDAVDVRAAVEAFDDGEEFVGCDGGGRGDLFAKDAEIVAGFDFGADVDLRGGIVADEDDGEAGRAAGAGEGIDAGFQLREDFIADAFAVEEGGGHTLVRITGERRRGGVGCLGMISGLQVRGGRLPCRRAGPGCLPARKPAD